VEHHVSDFAVIFDVDGVLVNSYQAHFESWQRLYREMNLPYGEAEFAAGFGRTSREILRDKFGPEMTDVQFREIDEKKERYYREAFRESFVPMDGAVELVNALRRDGVPLAIGSSGPPENVALAVELLGLASQFQARVSGVDVTRGKPDPQVFLLAAERIDVEPRNCAVVEDAVHGITAANSAGMRSIAITGTSTRDRLAHAHLIVDSLRELTPERIRHLVRTMQDCD
jgi:beta-phosphoglucomutase